MFGRGMCFLREPRPPYRGFPGSLMVLVWASNLGPLKLKEPNCGEVVFEKKGHFIDLAWLSQACACEICISLCMIYHFSYFIYPLSYLYIYIYILFHISYNIYLYKYLITYLFMHTSIYSSIRLSESTKTIGFPKNSMAGTQQLVVWVDISPFFFFVYIVISEKVMPKIWSWRWNFAKVPWVFQDPCRGCAHPFLGSSSYNSGSKFSWDLGPKIGGPKIIKNLTDPQGMCFF